MCREKLDLKVNISNASYEWSTGERTKDIIVTAGGTYWVKVNNGSCTVSDTIKVNMQARPVFDLGADKDIFARVKLLCWN